MDNETQKSFLWKFSTVGLYLSYYEKMKIKLLGSYKNQKTNISKIRRKQKNFSPVFIAHKSR